MSAFVNGERAIFAAVRRLCAEGIHRSGTNRVSLGQRSRLSFEHHLGELLKLYQVATARRLRGGPEA